MIRDMTCCGANTLESYSREGLLSYLNNPTRHGLWSLTVTIENPEVYYNNLTKRDPEFKNYPPIFSWLVGIWLGDITALVSSEDDHDTALLKRAGLILDEDRYFRRRIRSRGFPIYGRRGRLTPQKKKSKSGLYSEEIAKAKELLPFLHNVVSDAGFDFMSLTKPCHFSIVEEGRKRNQFEVLSVDRITLEHFHEVLSLFHSNAGCECKMLSKKMYTPENKVFIPYFHALYLACNAFSISTNPDLVREINSSLTEVFEGKPDGAIRCCGLAMDFLLEEIYETCFREKAPDKPLGELFDSISSKARQILEGNIATQAIHEEPHEFKRLAEIIDGEKGTNVGSCAEVTRLVLHENKEILKRLDKIETKLQISKKSPNPFFSQSMLDSVRKSLDMRNAGSHRGREELTPYHAAMCMKGVINLLNWWEDQNRSISNWDEETTAVVRRLSQCGPGFVV